MKINKKYLTIGGLSLLAIGCISILATSKGSIFSQNYLVATARCEQCSGNHYTGVNRDGKIGLNHNGVYEYWHCCKCDGRYFFKEDIPGGWEESKWVDNGTTNPYMDATNLDDNRIQFGGTQVIHKINHLTDGDITIDGQRDDKYDNAVKYSFEDKAIWTEHGGSNLKASLEAVWKDKMLYIYIDVDDPTYAQKDCSDTSTNNSSYDNLEFRIDTLHTQKYANSKWDGYINSDYRKLDGSYDYAAEGKFRISAGYDLDAQCAKTDGTSGCFFDPWCYFSSVCINDGKTRIISKYNEDNTHWTVEMGINLEHDATILNSFGEIGMLFKINDKSAKDYHQGIVNFENIGDAYNYPRNFSNFRLMDFDEFGKVSEDESVVSEIKTNASASDWTFTNNTITTNSVGTYLSNSSYTNFTTLLDFNGVNQDDSIDANPYFAHKPFKSFLFGGGFDSSGVYNGYALDISKTYVDILKVSGYTSTFLDGYAIDLGTSKIRLTMNGKNCYLSYGDGTLLGTSHLTNTNRIKIADYVGGKVGILCNDASATTITIHEIEENGKVNPIDFYVDRGQSVVNEIKTNTAGSDWAFSKNKITTNSKGHYLGSTSYNDFTAILSFDSYSPLETTEANPFASGQATKAFLFGGNDDETGKYSGYALNISKNWFQILKLDGTASTFIDGYEIDPENLYVKLTLSGTKLSLVYANGSSLGTSMNNVSEIELTDYVGGKVGVLSNDTYQTNVNIYEIK